jgi:hypothetical protein
MDSQDMDRDVAGEEQDAPQAQQTAGPAGTLPVGPAVDNPSEGDPVAPGTAERQRSAPVPEREGGEAPAPDPHPDAEDREPIGEWIDDDDTKGFGAEQPPGG